MIWRFGTSEPPPRRGGWSCSLIGGRLRSPPSVSSLSSARSAKRRGRGLVGTERLRLAEDENEPMPFSKHYIEHEHIETMRTAFYKVCDALLLKGEVDDPITEFVVNKIVALANAGEHD